MFFTFNSNKKQDFLKKAFILSGFAFSFASFVTTSEAFSLSEIFTEKVSAQNETSTKHSENIQNMDVLGEDTFTKKLAKSSLFKKILSFNDDALSPDIKLEEETDHAHDESAIYTVKKGESLQSIASYFSVSLDTIITFNKLDEARVYEGDVLEIPNISGILYTVKKGDTINSVAKEFKLDPEDISLYNGLISELPLEVDTDIFLPGAKLPVKEVKKETKTKDKKSTTATSSKNTGKKTTGSDVSAISKLKKESGKYSQLPKLPGYFTFPAPGSTRTQKMHGHNSVDLGAPAGTPVVAAAEGTITVARDTGWNYGYGKYIVISHPNGTQTVYAHLSTINVSVGQSVARGQKIAGVGNTGNSTGPHLHFEVRGAYNPFAW